MQGIDHRMIFHSAFMHLLRPLLLLSLIFQLESDFFSKIETKSPEYQAKSNVHENLLKGY